MKSLKLIPFLLSFLLIESCGLLDQEEIEIPDYASDLVGNYEVIYSSKSFTSLSSIVKVEKSSNDEILIIPSVQSGHLAFTATLALTTTDNLGVKISEQASGDITITGGTLQNSTFNGGYLYDDSTFVYTVAYTQNGVSDTVLAVGNYTFDEFGSEEDNGGGNGGEEPVLASFPVDTLFESGEDIWMFDFLDVGHGIVYSETAVSKSLHVTSDGGATWTKQDWSGDRIRDIEYFDANKILVSTGTTYLSEDGGTTWENVVSSDFVTAYGNSHFVTSYFHSTDGRTWSEIIFDTSEFEDFGAGMFDAYYYDETHLFAFFRDGSNGNIYVGTSADGGATIKIISQPINSYVNGSVFVSESEGFAIGDFGGIIHTEDGGINWEIVPGTSEEQFGHGIHIDGQYGFAMYNYPLFTNNGGESWTKIYDPRQEWEYFIATGSGSSMIGMGEEVIYTDGANGGRLYKIDLSEVEFPEG